MSIKSGINHAGIPVTVRDISFDGLEESYGKDEFAGLILFKTARYLESAECQDNNEKYKALIKEFESKWPECKQLINDLDGIVIAKENELFAAGFKQGLEALMTAVSFNRLHIINTEFIDLKAIDKQRGGNVNV